jgi:hypothetical protein
MPNKEDIMAPKPIIEKMLPWISGVTMPLLIVVLSALWGVSNTMSTMAAENEVLKVRTNNMERAILEIKTSVNQMSSTVNEMKIQQATHSALVELKVDTIRKDIETLRQIEREDKQSSHK